MRFGEFLAERNLAFDPVRRERQYDKMTFDASRRIARDRLTKSDEFEWRDRKPSFLAHFADYRLLQRFAQFDHPAGQGMQPVRRRPGSPHDQHPAVAEYRRAHRQIWPRWISPRGLAVAH